MSSAEERAAMVKGDPSPRPLLFPVSWYLLARVSSKSGAPNGGDHRVSCATHMRLPFNTAFSVPSGAIVTTQGEKGTVVKHGKQNALGLRQVRIKLAASGKTVWRPIKDCRMDGWETYDANDASDAEAQAAEQLEAADREAVGRICAFSVSDVVTAAGVSQPGRVMRVGASHDDFNVRCAHAHAALRLLLGCAQTSPV